MKLMISAFVAATLFAAAVASADPVTATKDAGRDVGHHVAQAGRATGHEALNLGREGGHAVAQTGRDIGHGVKHAVRHRRHHRHA
jgi:hypothetical protein